MRTHALYPGSFDVLTNGHLDLIRRASTVFSQVTVAVACNRSKVTPLFTVPERIDMLNQSLADIDNADAASFGGLTVEFAREIGATVILRGLRAVSDFEFELQMAMMNETLDGQIITVFMAPSPEFSFLSSSVVKEVARYGGDIATMVPPSVYEQVMKRIEVVK